jgi:hypothetical protein
MPRHKTGGAVFHLTKKGKKPKKIWYARIQFFDDYGKRKQVHRKPEYNSETSARSKAREMLAEHDNNPRSFDAPEMTFNDLADFYETTYLVEPEYRDGRNVAGLRSKYDCEKRLKVLREFFGKKRLRTITHGDLQRYRTFRLKTPIVVGRNTKGTDKKGKPQERPRSIACSPGTLHYASRLECRCSEQLDRTEPLSARRTADQTGRGESEGKNIKSRRRIPSLSSLPQ